jgi:hypothetical protein
MIFSALMVTYAGPLFCHSFVAEYSLKAPVVMDISSIVASSDKEEDDGVGSIAPIEKAG